MLPILLETKGDSDASVSFRDESGILCRLFSMRQKLHLMLPFLLETKATSHADVPLRGECVMSCCRFSYLMTSHADVLIDKSDISRLRSSQANISNIYESGQMGHAIIVKRGILCFFCFFRRQKLHLILPFFL